MEAFYILRKAERKYLALLRDVIKLTKCILKYTKILKTLCIFLQRMKMRVVMKKKHFNLPRREVFSPPWGPHAATDPLPPPPLMWPASLLSRKSDGVGVPLPSGRQGKRKKGVKRSLKITLYRNLLPDGSLYAAELLWGGGILLPFIRETRTGIKRRKWEFESNVIWKSVTAREFVLFRGTMGCVFSFH